MSSYDAIRILPVSSPSTIKGVTNREADDVCCAPADAPADAATPGWMSLAGRFTNVERDLGPAWARAFFQTAAIHTVSARSLGPKGSETRALDDSTLRVHRAKSAGASRPW